jgi:hypothetical protein
VDETRDQATNERARKPYVKPQIQEVPLRPEEAVLGGCKTASKSGSTQFRCNAPKKCSSTTS